MSKWKEKADKVIAIIRSRPEWEPAHTSMKFGDHVVRYYDTADKGAYQLKHDKAELFLISHVVVQLQLPVEDLASFNVDSWLDELLEIVKEDYVMMAEKKYVLVPASKDEK